MIPKRVLCSLGGFFLLAALVLVTSAAPAQQAFRRGDCNADGVVDVADMSFLCRYLGRLGPSPPCGDAADANDDGRIDIVDLVVIHGYLAYDGREIPAPGPITPGLDPTDTDGITCNSYAPLPQEKKADFTLKFLCPEIPSAAPGETVRWTAYAALRAENNTAGHGAQAWSLSFSVDGARIAGVTTDGTTAAEVLDGERRAFEVTGAVDPQLDTGSGPQGEGAVSTVVLDCQRPTALPADGTSRILAITLEAVVPEGGLGPVALSFVDGMRGSAQPVRNVISLDGVAYAPSFGGCGPLFPDCNRNDIDDAEEIASGASKDCDGNGVPDECEIAKGADCNENGVLDSCDITSGVSLDCDANGLPDECDIERGAADCNGNGVPDPCDIASGASLDCDQNGVPDECQPDCNGNRFADSCDIASGAIPDADGDGLPDECAGCGWPAPCQSGEGPAFELGFRGPCALSGQPGEERVFGVLAMLSSNCALGPPTEPGISTWGSRGKAARSSRRRTTAPSPPPLRGEVSGSRPGSSISGSRILDEATDEAGSSA